MNRSRLMNERTEPSSPGNISQISITLIYPTLSRSPVRVRNPSLRAGNYEWFHSHEYQFATPLFPALFPARGRSRGISDSFALTTRMSLVIVEGCQFPSKDERKSKKDKEIYNSLQRPASRRQSVLHCCLIIDGNNTLPMV